MINNINIFNNMNRNLRVTQGKNHGENIMPKKLSFEESFRKQQPQFYKKSLNKQKLFEEEWSTPMEDVDRNK